MLDKFVVIDDIKVNVEVVCFGIVLCVDIFVFVVVNVVRLVYLNVYSLMVLCLDCLYLYCLYLDCLYLDCFCCDFYLQNMNLVYEFDELLI